MDPAIRTERLLLRSFREADAPALHRIANQPYILRWMPDFESTPERTLQLIRFFIERFPHAKGSTARMMFAAELQGALIGMVGIGNKEEVDNEIELAYFVDEAFAGNGYITEAARVVSRWALENLGLEYLIAIVETDNLPSRRVVEKCGFQKVDTRMILNSGDTVEKPFDYYRLYCR